MVHQSMFLAPQHGHELTAQEVGRELSDGELEMVAGGKRNSASNNNVNGSCNGGNTGKNKGKKNKDAMTRKAVLDKLGRINNEHMNSRSKESAEAIGDMLDDTDSGVRLGALEYLRTNQDVKESKVQIGKILDKLIPKVSKPMPTGKNAGNAASACQNFSKCSCMYIEAASRATGTIQ